MIHTDQLGRAVNVPDHPQRIVSLVPSITETLFDLGLEKYMVGRTRYCIHPKEKVERIAVVGGTKKIVKERLLKLNPDLVLANKEENTKEDVDWCAEHFPTWVSDVVDVPSALEMIESLGEMTGTNQRAQEITSEIQTSFAHLRSVGEKRCVVYLIWKDPFMAAGSDTFISQMLDVAGFRNAVSSTRYPILIMQDIETMQPDFVFLSSEPYRFTEAHADELQTVLVKSKVVLVDGEMFSWYGSRMLQSARYFSELCMRLTAGESRNH